jgi:hypothetical protein
MAGQDIQLDLFLDATQVEQASKQTEATLKSMANNSSVGIRKLENAFQDMGISAFGVTGPIARIGDALMEFVPGGIVGAGVVAGVGGIIYAFNRQKQIQKDLEEAQAGSKKSLESLRLEYIRLKEGVEAYNIALLQSTETTAKSTSASALSALTKYFDTVDQKAKTAALAMLDFSGAAGGRIIDPAELERVTQQKRLEILRQTAVEREKLEKAFTDAETARIAAQAAIQEDAQSRGEKSSSDAASARQKLLQAEFNEFKQLFDLQNSGYGLNAERQARLNELSNQYADILNNINAPLDQLNVAKQAEEIVARAITQEYEKQQKAAEELAKREKEIADEQKKRLEDSGKLAEQAAKNALANSKAETDLLIMNFEKAKGINNEFTASLKQALETARAELAIAQAEGLAGPILEAQNRLAQLEKTAAESVQEGALFNTVQIGVNALADAFSAMGAALAAGKDGLKAFGQAAKQAIGQSLQILGREQLVKGLSNLASGFAAAALGPIGGKSSKDFFKAAGLNFAAASLAGVAGGAMGGSSGAGGVGGGGFSNSQLGRNTFSTQPTTIIVQGGSLLDMSNPDTQRTFIGALETVSNRRIKFNMAGA